VVESAGATPPPETGGDGGAPTARRRRPPLAVIIIGAVVLIVALIWGVRYLAYATTHQSTDDARVDADTVTITSKISERVGVILVDTDQPVRKGQVVIRLDNRDELTALRQAQATLAAQRSQARAAQANVDLTRVQVAAQATQGVGGVTAARSLIKNAQAQTQSAQQQADAAFAQAGSLQAQVKAAQDRFDYTVIRSPIDGVVGAKNVEIGAAVSPGQSLMSIIPSHHIYITANYKETQLGRVAVGQPVDISVDAYKGVAFEGHVCAIAPASQNTFSLVPAQNATGNFVKVTQRIPVRVCPDNPPANDPLRVGMSVTTSIKVK
jgi:membrane fusion protein (multidrug efflux system)